MRCRQWQETQFRLFVLQDLGHGRRWQVRGMPQRSQNLIKGRFHQGSIGVVGVILPKRVIHGSTVIVTLIVRINEWETGIADQLEMFVGSATTEQQWSKRIRKVCCQPIGDGPIEARKWEGLEVGVVTVAVGGR